MLRLWTRKVMIKHKAFLCTTNTSDNHKKNESMARTSEFISSILTIDTLSMLALATPSTCVHPLSTQPTQKRTKAGNIKEKEPRIQKHACLQNKNCNT